ncbi:hypothetical protein EC609_25910 [Achromobacter denitrificans]|nr:hypothetical protein EC609_25910 [Achromobacter denitrificans]
MPFLCERTLHRFRTNHGEQVSSARRNSLHHVKSQTTFPPAATSATLASPMEDFHNRPRARQGLGYRTLVQVEASEP